MFGMVDNDLLQLLTSSKMKTGNNYGTGVILYDPSTRSILVGERTDTHNFCTPGGKVELGESPLDGIIRETKEESNLKLNSVVFLGYRAHTSSNGKNWVSFMFLSTDFEGDIKPQESEIVSWNWMPLDSVMSLDLFPPTAVSLSLASELDAFSQIQSTYEENNANGSTPQDKSIPSNNYVYNPNSCCISLAEGMNINRGVCPDIDFCSYSHVDDLLSIL